MPVCVVALVLTAMAGTPAVDSLSGVAGGLPAKVAGLAASMGEDATYSPETIYSYLNGGAEVYLAYGMRACFARRYAGEAGDVLVDLFEMPSSSDAFGAFTLDQDGEEEAIGQAALLREGWLSFWKGRFFVSVTADFGGDAAREALLAVGRAAATAIREEGEPPPLVCALPEAGRDARSVRWVRHPVVLAAHLFLAPGDPLSLASGGEAVLASYRREDATARVVIVDYPSAEAAAAALSRGRRALLAEADESGVATDVDGRWRAIGGDGRTVALVVEATARNLAEALLAEALKPRLAPRCGTKGRGA